MSSNSSDQISESEVISVKGNNLFDRLKKFGHRFAIAIALLIFCAAVYVLHRELSAIRLEEVVTQFQLVPLSDLALALLLAAGGYLMLTNYDRLAIAYVGKDLPYKKIMAISFTAYAVGNNIGVTSLSGGSIRYRAYSGQGLTAIEIAKVIVFCSLTFGVGASTMLGLALLMEPPAMLSHLGFQPPILTAIALLALVLPVGYIIGSRRFKEIRLGHWTVEWPRTNLCVQQILFSCCDIALTAGILYVLLPDALGISYLGLLGAFLIAAGLGVVSNVPGGLGVLEGMLLLLLPQIPQATLLGALLGYRIIYYLIPLTVALIMLAAQELKKHRQRLTKTVATTGIWIGSIAPQVMGASVFLAGAALVFSDVVPRIESRIAGIEKLVPLSLVEASNMVSSAIGVALLILARGLYRRLQGAYYVALSLLLLGVFAALLKGFDYEEAIILGCVALFLWIGRDEFYRPAALIDQRFTPGWLLSVALVIGGSIWLGYFQYHHIEYRNDLWWQFAFDGDISRMLRASLVALVVAVGFGLMRLMRPAQPEPGETSPEELAKVKQILAHSTSALVNVALLGDKRFLIHESGEAFIMYQVSGRSWIALGDPVGKIEHHEALAWQFRELSDRHGARCVFYQVSDDHLPLYLDLGLSLSKLGEEAKVDLEQFSLEGSKYAEFRRAINKARREGISFEVVPAENVPGILAELKPVSDAWLKDKNVSEKGFSLGTFDEKYLSNFDIAVVRVEGKVVAFSNIWKSGEKNEVSIDLMRYSDQAPKAIMDYLFGELLVWGKEQGYRYFALGSAPLSGLEQHSLANLWHKIGNTIFRFGDHFYNFDGLRRYKEKFDPIWEPSYLAAPGGLAMSGVLIDSTILISGGVKQVFSR